MNIRASGTEARWTLREAAWELEERVLWPGLDRTQDVAARAAEALAPAQRLIETKLAWPLADRWNRSSSAARAGVAAAMISAAVGAGWAGAALGTGDAVPTALDPRPAATLASPSVAEENPTLYGESPKFAAAPAATAEGVAAGAEKAKGRPAKTITEADAVTTGERFAKAFVAYEIGKADDEVIASFREVATPALVKALTARPPRLPDDAKVPKARVVNVLLGRSGKKQAVLSVALARLQSVSEIRLTLIKGKDRWRVTEVLG